MNIMKKKILALLVITVICFGIGYVLTNSYDFGLCYANVDTNTFDSSCINFYERIGDPLFYGMGALALVFLILTFVPKAFSWWWKFAVWFIPLAIIVFVITPDPQGWVSPIPYPETVFQWVSGFYIIVSIFIIGAHTAKER